MFANFARYTRCFIAASLGCAPFLLPADGFCFEATLNSPRAQAAAQAAAQARSREAASQPAPSTGRIRVKYRRQSPTEAGRSPGSDVGSQVAKSSDARIETTVSAAPGLATIVLDRRVSDEELARIAASIAASPDVEYAVPEKIERAQQVDDLRFSEQWDLTDQRAGIHAPGAWPTTTGQDVVIAVLDTGIRKHVDLASQLIEGYDFVSDVSRSRDGDGRDADPSDPGDWCLDDAIPMSSWHGTHVAGTIAAIANNHEGIAGVAPRAKIMPVRVLGRCGGSNFDIADAIRWASGGNVDGVPANPHPAKVINLSLGGPGLCDSEYADAILEARSRGTTVVVAAGNDDADSAGFRPANCDGVISVAAINRQGARAFFGGVGRGSNFGANVKIAAPGGETFSNPANGILSTLNTGIQGPGNDSYEAYQGTSMAAPHVSGVAALIYQIHPGITPDEVLSILRSTSIPFPLVTTRQCDTSTCGSGIVNAEAAVIETMQRSQIAAVPTPPAVAAASTAAQRKSINALSSTELLSLRRGVAQMMAWNNAPRESPEFRRSWIFWANMHAHFGDECGGAISGSGMNGVQTFASSNPAETDTWCRCEHGSRLFLTWHRMYLWYFERVLQAAAGDNSLRLPYWDYATDPNLPAAYRDRTYVDEAGRTKPNPLRVEARAPRLNDGTAGLRRNVTSASDAMAARRYQTFNDLIEQTPHGAVHCAMVTGSCPNGLMGAIPASALDPIFYAHHTNIDRLYECWLSADEAGRLPTDPTELATEFTFIDADGSTAKRRVRDMLRLSQLGYSYSNCPARPAMVAAAGVQRVAQASDESLESAVAGITLAGPTRLAAGVTRVPINLPETQRERVTAEAAPSTDRRALIVIDGLKFDANPNTLYNVYLSDDTGRREPIGVISFFNFTAPQTGERAAHAAHSGQFKLDATRALQALAADSAATPSLIFEPTTGLTDSSPADAGASAAATVNQGANVRFDSARLVITD